MTMTPSVLFDLSGKTALVTGGATGIGRMATTGLMAAGARVLGSGEPKIGAHGKPVLFLHPKDFNGCLVELEQV